ncbi:site-specific integrase [Phytohabitans aurantiacus]|uniref:Uncharacterized protein n=1 Tax=Phytohabitans aurantiacus TaxID=3016789 RepID=A0ABQ5R6S3_9ACTN|nr:hypothetical protein [Phytohabitans aurantiacus]GLI02464.1 hypothetical protein Pa4123_77420 [Phytohabitans aurantiacus]
MREAASDLQLLLRCPRDSAVEMRDYAIPMLVTMARLLLDDLDWRSGEIVVRSKGRREDRLPLPVEVGEAVVAYFPTPSPGSTIAICS